MENTDNSSLKAWYHDSADKIRAQARAPERGLSLIYRPSFKADKEQGIYYSTQDSVMNMFGYCDLYDIAFGIACDMNTIKMEFGDYRIQFWKSGDYKNMGLGGEMGIYKNDGLGYVGFYNTAKLFNYMPMSFALYEGDGTAPVFIRSDSAHWWLNGFVPGYDGVSAKDIRMIGSIIFKNQSMLNGFVNSLPSSVDYAINGLRVDYDWQ